MIAYQFLPPLLPYLHAIAAFIPKQYGQIVLLVLTDQLFGFWLLV
jgi:hypothetical protein